MSSLLKEEMQRVLFRPEKLRLAEFIEIEEPTDGRHFLCVSGKQHYTGTEYYLGCESLKRNVVNVY